MSRVRRVDANHREVLDALRQVGAFVLDVHELPGACDAVVFFRGVATLLEIKDGAKPQWARKLTKAEADTIAQVQFVGCPVAVVETVEQALRAVGAV